MKKIKKCIFPSAGYGTRFLPITKTIPKEMLPIHAKPLIQYGVEEAIESGCEIIGIVTNGNKKAIEDYFDYNFEVENAIKNTSKENTLDDLNKIIKNTHFTYTRQTEIKGLGHAIFSAKPLVGNEAFGVILADDLCVNQNDGILSQMMRVYEKYPNHCIIAVEEIDLKDSNQYGIISGENIEKNIIKVNDMLEKPEEKDTLSNLAIIGRYILTPKIFDVLENTKKGKDDEIQITDALLELANQGEVLAYKFKGKRFDCGRIDGFMDASIFFQSFHSKIVIS